MNVLIRARGRRLRTAALAACVSTVSILAAPTPAGTQTPGFDGAEVDSVRVSGRKHVRSGQTARVAGALASGQAGRTVVVQVRRGGAWRTVARTRTRADGRFRTSWRPRRPGRYSCEPGPWAARSPRGGWPDE